MHYKALKGLFARNFVKYTREGTWGKRKKRFYFCPRADELRAKRMFAISSSGKRGSARFEKSISGRTDETKRALRSLRWCRSEGTAGRRAIGLCKSRQPTLSMARRHSSQPRATGFILLS